VLDLSETNLRRNEFVQYQVGGPELCVDVQHDEPEAGAAIVSVDDLPELVRRLSAAGVQVGAGGLDAGWLQVSSMVKEVSSAGCIVGDEPQGEYASTQSADWAW
jgi:hypothetical protein